MANSSRPQRLVMRGLGLGCELRDLDERSRLFWLRAGNMDHANAASMVGEKRNVNLERNGVSLEVVVKTGKLETRNTQGQKPRVYFTRL
jgi:hypothetical protein